MQLLISAFRNKIKLKYIFIYILMIVSGLSCRVAIAAHLQLTGKLKLHGFAQWCVNTSGTRIAGLSYSSNTDSSLLSVFNIIQTRKNIKVSHFNNSTSLSGNPHDVSFSQSGHFILVLTESNLYLLRIRSGSLAMSIIYKLHRPISSACLTPNMNYILCVEDDPNAVVHKMLYMKIDSQSRSLHVSKPKMLPTYNKFTEPCTFLPGKDDTEIIVGQHKEFKGGRLISNHNDFGSAGLYDIYAGPSIDKKYVGVECKTKAVGPYLIMKPVKIRMKIWQYENHIYKLIYSNPLKHRISNIQISGTDKIWLSYINSSNIYIYSLKK